MLVLQVEERRGRRVDVASRRSGSVLDTVIGLRRRQLVELIRQCLSS